jgi:hypothetical protein
MKNKLMKNKLLFLFTVTLLFSGMAFAHNNNGGDKGKNKGKKPAPTTCPGKTCGKKKTN